MLTVLSHGSSYDRARLLFIYVRCKVASASLSHFTQRTFGECEHNEPFFPPLIFSKC